MENENKPPSKSFLETNRNLLILGAVSLLGLFMVLFTTLASDNEPDIVFLESSKRVYVMDVDASNSQPQLIFEASSNTVLGGSDYSAGDGYFLTTSRTIADDYSDIVVIDIESGTMQTLFDCSGLRRYCEDFIANPDTRSFIYSQVQSGVTGRIFYADFEDGFTQTEITSAGLPIAWVDASRFTYFDETQYTTEIYNTQNDSSETIVEASTAFYLSPNNEHFVNIYSRFLEPSRLQVGELGEDNLLADEEIDPVDDVEFVGWLADNSGFLYFVNVNDNIVPNSDCERLCRVSLMHFDIASGNIRELREIRGNLRQADLNSDGNRILFTIWQHTVGQEYFAYIYTIDTNSLQSLANVPNSALWLD